MAKKKMKNMNRIEVWNATDFCMDMISFLHEKGNRINKFAYPNEALKDYVEELERSVIKFHASLPEDSVEPKVREYGNFEVGEQLNINEYLN